MNLQPFYDDIWPIRAEMATYKPWMKYQNDTELHRTLSLLKHIPNLPFSGFAQPAPYAIQREIRKLGLSALPHYGPYPKKNSELIPITLTTPSQLPSA